MTSPNTGLRRTALVVLAVGAALGASACSAGQVSQTAYQVAAVDGGSGSAGDLAVNDFQVVLPESGEAGVRFVASYTGSGLGDAVTLDRVEIDGEEVQLGQRKPLERGCSLVVAAPEDANPVPAPNGVCVDQTTGTLPNSDGFDNGVSVPATVSFSNGDRIEVRVGVVAEGALPGAHQGPAESAASSEGH